MKRREIITLLGGAVLACPLAALSQQPQRVARIGFLSGGFSQTEARWLAVLRQTMAELGWQEGRNLEIVVRHAGGDASRGPSLAAELVSLKPDGLIAAGSPDATYLQAITRSIPIVFMIAADPVAQGFVESLAQPGGNTTGIASAATLLEPKRLELLAEMLGRVDRVSYFSNPDWRTTQVVNFPSLLTAAAKLNIEVRTMTVRDAVELEVAFDAAAHWHTDAIIVPLQPVTLGLAEAIAERAARDRVPIIYEGRAFVEAGGLMSFTTDQRENFRRGARLVDKLLRGTHPRDLPVEQADRIELVINLKAAKALGLTVPQSILLRADEVIE